MSLFGSIADFVSELFTGRSCHWDAHVAIEEQAAEERRRHLEPKSTGFSSREQAAQDPQFLEMEKRIISLKTELKQAWHELRAKYPAAPGLEWSSCLNCLLLDDDRDEVSEM